MTNFNLDSQVYQSLPVWKYIVSRVDTWTKRKATTNWNLPSRCLQEFEPRDETPEFRRKRALGFEKSLFVRVGGKSKS